MTDSNTAVAGVFRFAAGVTETILARDEEIATLRRQLDEAAAADQEWRTVVDGLTGRLDEAQLSLPDGPYRVDGHSAVNVWHDPQHAPDGGGVGGRQIAMATSPGWSRRIVAALNWMTGSGVFVLLPDDWSDQLVRAAAAGPQDVVGLVGSWCLDIPPDEGRAQCAVEDPDAVAVVDDEGLGDEVLSAPAGPSDDRPVAPPAESGLEQTQPHPRVVVDSPEQAAALAAAERSGWPCPNPHRCPHPTSMHRLVEGTTQLPCTVDGCGCGQADADPPGQPHGPVMAVGPNAVVIGPAAAGQVVAGIAATPFPTALSCPNFRCDHPRVVHDIEDYGDPIPMCCEEGCVCGHPPGDWRRVVPMVWFAPGDTVPGDVTVFGRDGRVYPADGSAWTTDAPLVAVTPRHPIGDSVPDIDHPGADHLGAGGQQVRAGQEGMADA